MSQSKEKRADKKLVEQAPSSKAITRERPGRWVGFTIIAAVMAVILIIVGIFYYQENVAPFRRTIITVDSITINMDYFLKRVGLAEASPMSMLEVITNEQLLKLEAPRYGIKVSPEEIDQELRRIARGSNETISESEFKEWYRQVLNEIGLSDSEYKDILSTSLLATHLREYLAERMPTVAEQVHVYTILVGTLEDAKKIKARWEAGEDFSDLAREVSLDKQSGEKGGDLGWLPRGIIELRFEYMIFNLSPGEVSIPLPASSLEATEESGYLLFMVSEEAAARELSEEHQQMLRDVSLESWLLGQIQYHDIKYNFDTETQAWINWQLSKR